MAAGNKDNSRDMDIPPPAFRPPCEVEVGAEDRGRDRARAQHPHRLVAAVEACTRDRGSRRHRDSAVAPTENEGAGGHKSYPNLGMSWMGVVMSGWRGLYCM